ncbi:hypothetical protein JCM19314_2981 [Nonlabens ulvanivorans]|uniref:Uncharacterized protein n=1 Tax=Nonlabens ulvanivorans TaxID=906888 RepID=A0A090Q7H9_NONUL|nr:hypothetical protein JCM19314_2981 [Nonlabens ulvanivorans]
MMAIIVRNDNADDKWDLGLKDLIFLNLVVCCISHFKKIMDKDTYMGFYLIKADT